MTCSISRVRPRWRGLAAVLPLLAGLGVGCGSSTKPEVQPTTTGRDWTQYPAVVTLTGTQEIDVLGDVHGDPVVTAKVLAAAGLVPNGTSTWTGGQAVLVVTGDVIDKGAAATPIIDLLIALEPQAAAAGGRLVVTLGNHEAEFVADPTADKSSTFRSELTSLGLDPATVASGQTKYGIWLATRPVAALIDGWFFSHAGNSQGLSANQIASNFQSLFTKKGVPHFDDPFLVGNSSLLEAQSWWFGTDRASTIGNLDFDLAALPATHLVFGHDPGAIAFPDDPAGDRPQGQMISRYEGRIFLIDVGMSYAVGYSSGSLLRISRGATDTATEVFADGTLLPL